ncbi:MAG: GNAT family N-acetyltransferase [Pseudomonadota bacterium]
MTELRNAVEADISALAALWHSGWREAHMAHVPENLVAMRTAESFLIRTRRHLQSIRTAGTEGAPLGMCIVKDHIIEHIYVAPSARGSGLANDLIEDGLRKIAEADFTTAELAVIPENARAIAFYKKTGWREGSIKNVSLETLAEPFDLACIIMHKNV